MFTSLKFKLITLTIVVEVIMLSILIGNSLRLVDKQSHFYIHSQLKTYQQIFNHSFATPIFERNFASASNNLERIIDNHQANLPLVHAVVVDEDNRVFSQLGSHPNESQLQQDVDKINFNIPYIKLQSDISLSGIRLGHVTYIISIKNVSDFRTELLKQTYLIAALEVIASLLVLFFIAAWLTRNLDQLILATESIGDQDFDIVLNINSNDEIGILASKMNRMSQRLKHFTVTLQNKNEELSAIADYSTGCEIWLDPDKNVKWVSPSAKQLLGFSVEEILTMRDFPLNLAHEDDKHIIQQALDESRNHEVSSSADFRILRKNNRAFWCVFMSQIIYSIDHKNLGIRASIIDISDRVEANAALKNSMQNLEKSHQIQQDLLKGSREEQARLRSLLTSMSIGILYENLQGEVDYFNPSFARIWAIEESSIYIGMRTQDVLNHSSNVIAHPDHFSKHILDVEHTNESSESFEILTADGRTINQLSYPVVDDDNRFIGRIWMYEDVTRQKQTAEQLLYLAERDHLTGLYNRRRFQEELDKMLSTFKRTHAKFALLFFDLDEFKYINDTFGHRAGDSVLIRIGGELSNMIRSDGFLSRLGGDEFGILAPIKTQSEAMDLANRVIQAVSSLPFRFEGKNLRITTSVGIAHFPEHGHITDDLVAKADTAMYAAKQRGKNTARTFEQQMFDSGEMTQHLTWNERIITALADDKFVLHYQEIRSLHTGKASHYELLIRMQDDEHPDKLIMPANFIPMAEKSGKIMLIDQWVVKKTIDILAETPEIPSLALNISGRSLDEPALAHQISSYLVDKKVDPKRLIVELTETAAVSDLADAQRFIEQMHRIGCRVYLDDFGAGFSTFSYLKHINADALKFDGQFIVNLSNDHENQIFVRSMVTIAKGLGKKTVAEFVEDADTMALLKELGVDMVQGYYVHKPSAEISL